jgi:hypothetical protein
MISVEQLCHKWKALKSRRDPWLDIWQELAEVYLPGKAHFTAKRVEGERDNEQIYDSTPRRAARELAAAIDGLIKPKTSNWFQPFIEDDKVMEQYDVKRYLDVVQERMWRAIYRTEARFIQRSSEVDSNLVVHGWGVLWTAENRGRNGLLFKSFHNANVAYDENADGVIDTLGICEELTARQVVGKYGEANVHPKILENLTNTESQKHNKKFEIVQLVLPNTDYDAKLIGPRGMPFRSVIFDYENKHVMQSGGFHEFPAAVPRWDTEAGHTYPRSPGMIALPDALTLQAISRTLLVAGERTADPPLMVPSDAFLSPVRTFPGGLSVFDVQALVDGGLSSPVFPLPTATNLPVGREMQADYRFQVESSFYRDVMRIPEGAPTATEVLEKKEEFIRALGPIFGRLEADYVGAMINRIYNIMDRARAFPDKPGILNEVPLQFRYQSPLQQARKAIDVAGLNRTLEITAPLVATRPDMLDFIDTDQIMADSPDWSGIPTKWVRNKDDIATDREARAEATQEQANLENAKPVAESLKAVAQAQEIQANVPPEEAI